MTIVFALFRLLSRTQLTRGRVTLIGLLGVLSIVVALGINRGNDGQLDTEAGAAVVWFLGLGLVVPIISLVLSSSSLGDLVEDETLVYLWHRPSPRWMLAVAAWTSSTSVAIPATVVPISLSGFIASGFDVGVLGASAVAVGVATAAYSSLFVLLGLVLKRALLWGLMYLFIWELFIARVGNGAATLSIVTYPSSILAQLVDIELPQADRSITTGVLVPVVISAIAVCLTAWRLDKIDVA